MCIFAFVFSGFVANGIPPGDYVDAAMMTSRSMTSLPPGVGGAKCQQPMGAQFSQQVRAVWVGQIIFFADRIICISGFCVYR